MGDYNLANLSGAQFRAELNLILTDLQACAYGSTAPATTTAGQVWVDSSGASPVLRIRNALNNGWIGIGTLASGGFELAGTSAAGRALIAAVSGAAITGPVSSSTAGDMNPITPVALTDASQTLTAAHLVTNKILVIPSSVARNLTLPTAATIITALGGFDAAFAKNVAFQVINTGAFDVTLLTNTGLTLVGKMVVNGGSGRWLARIDSASAVTIYTEAVAEGTLQSIQVFTVGGTWTRPAGCVRVRVRLVGGGGGGSTPGADNSGGGAGAGGYSERLISTAVTGSSQTVTVGAGGAAEGVGGTTSFGSLLSATGGTGATAQAGAPGGMGSGGDINIGGGGGEAAIGTSSTANAGSCGGSSVLGGGGHGVRGIAAGNPGRAFGGGGGGGSEASGGAGAAGVVIVEEFY